MVHSCVQRRRISEYRGKTAAVDTYCWLHKIMKANAGKELVKGGIYKYRFVKDCLRKIEKFRKEGLSIIMVLDGGPLPRKKDEELER